MNAHDDENRRAGSLSTDELVNVLIARLRLAHDAEDVREVTRRILVELEVDGMGGCRLCCS